LPEQVEPRYSSVQKIANQAPNESPAGNIQAAGCYGKKAFLFFGDNSSDGTSSAFSIHGDFQSPPIKVETKRNLCRKFP
jgi:hypothetical protein